MAIQISVGMRDARINVVETFLGPSPTLMIRSGPKPADCAAADTGVVLASIPLPANWLTDAVNGSKTINGGPWQDTNADADGIAEHFRIYDAGGVCQMQGTVGQGTGDMQLENINLVAGQQVSITQFTLTDANA